MVGHSNAPPMNSDGSWNMEVVLTACMDLKEGQIESRYQTRVLDHLYKHQSRKKQAISEIDANLSPSERGFQKWTIEQELDTEFSESVRENFPPEFIEKLKKQVIKSYYQKRFLSDFILKMDSIKLAKKQRVQLAKLDSQIRNEYQLAYSKLLVEEGMRLFRKLSNSQRERLWDLLGSEKKYELAINQLRFVPELTSRRQYFSGMSDSTYEDFLDFSPLLVNRSLLKAIDISDQQRIDCERSFKKHKVHFNRLISTGKSDEARDAVLQHNDEIESILLPHQIEILRQKSCLNLLQTSPMNFLATRYLRNALEITEKQIQKLAGDYSKITSEGDSKLAELKDKLDRKVLNSLDSEQRKLVVEILDFLE